MTDLTGSNGARGEQTYSHSARCASFVCSNAFDLVSLAPKAQPHPEQIRLGIQRVVLQAATLVRLSTNSPSNVEPGVRPKNGGSLEPCRPIIHIAIESFSVIDGEEVHRNYGSVPDPRYENLGGQMVSR